MQIGPGPLRPNLQPLDHLLQPKSRQAELPLRDPLVSQRHRDAGSPASGGIYLRAVGSRWGSGPLTRSSSQIGHLIAAERRADPWGFDPRSVRRQRQQFLALFVVIVCCTR